MSIKFLVLGGRVFWVFFGGEVSILFLWARGFSETCLCMAHARRPLLSATCPVSSPMMVEMRQQPQCKQIQ